MKNSTTLAIVIGLLIAGYIITNVDLEALSKTIEESGMNLSVSEEDIQDQFDYFIAKYRRSYDNSYEYEMRYQIFKDNFKKIQAHNAKSEIKGYTMGINQFGDLSNEEFVSQYLEFNGNIGEARTYSKPASNNPVEDMLNPSPTDQAMEDLKIPTYVDWIEKGAVTPVKDQGKCKASWAFAGIAAVESAYSIAKKQDLDLSEQQAIDCIETEHTKGCSGGWATDVFEYAYDNDLCAEEDYEYTGKEGSCTAWWSCHTDNYVPDYVEMDEHNRLSLYTALAEQPVVVAVDARNWQFYKSGIFSTDCDESVNHPVLAVGYSFNNYFFLWKNHFLTLKNSWGTEWGENGFIRLSSNIEDSPGMCGVYLEGYYPTVKDL